MLTKPTSSSPTRCDSADDSGIGSLSEIDGVSAVIYILQLVEELDGDS